MGPVDQREWSLGLAASGDAQVLAGDWLVRAAGAGEWRTVADRGLDESGWQATSTPGRWRLDAGLADESAVLYRRRFELPPDLAAELGGPHRTPDRDARWWLVASGLCELGHLWLDGTYLGDLRGRHAEHAFEVDQLLRSGPEHLAAVEAAHGAVRVPQSQDAQVQIERTGPARIERARALVIEASRDRAVLRISATVDSAGTHRAEITTTLLPAGGTVNRTAASHAAAATGHAASTTAASATGSASDGATLGDGLARSEPILARGRNELEWLVALEQPSLWWPAGMGDQRRYCMDIDLSVDGCSSHAVRLSTGVRTVALRSRKLYVNGERCGGGPDDVVTAQPDLAHRGAYEDADAVGTMLCQQIALDPSIYAGAERGLRALATQAAAGAADHAGHHPSVAAWQLVLPPSRKPWPRVLSRWAYRTMAGAMHAADPTRPVLPPDRR